MKKTLIYILTLTAIVLSLFAATPPPAVAAQLVLTEGIYIGESIEFVPTWYLRHLRGDVTNDGLLWSDLAAADQTKVTNELVRRTTGGTDGTIVIGTVEADSIVGSAGAANTVGGDITTIGGAGGAGALATTGGAGGVASVTSGAGGTTVTGTAGASGAVTLASGVGGAATGAGTGGAGGLVGVTGGVGGATTTSTAGAGGDVTVTAGAGGAASGAGTGGAGGTITLTPGAGGVTVAGTDGIPGMVKVGGTAGARAFGLNVVRSTITSTAEITVAQMRGHVLYQDASGGNVTMNTVTGTAMSAAFPDAATGTAIVLYVASNHASNTSTISGDTDFTLVGSGAVTQLGGTFLCIKTGATTWDLVRVG